MYTVEREQRLGFLLDVDNTLLDNDALKEHLAAALRHTLGDAGAARFWPVYEEVRRERDVVDLPLTAQRYASECSASRNDGHTDGAEEGGPGILDARMNSEDAQDAQAHLDRTLDTLETLNHILDTLPFDRFVYPHAFATLRYLATMGAVGILSDGDQVFQRQKIERSGLAAAVDGHVLIYAHKEQHLNEVAAAQPAQHTVLIDDKARILSDVKAVMGGRLTTVHVLQGHYAREPLPAGFQPDITIGVIGDLRAIDAARFMRAAL